MTGPPTGQNCAKCTEYATRSLGSQWLCEDHAEAIFAPIRARVVERESLTGAGRRVGIDRPDHGRYASDLGCMSCGATWVGIEGDPCHWCEDQRESAIAKQRMILLACSDPQRLAVAVQAGIITADEGRRALGVSDAA